MHFWVIDAEPWRTGVLLYILWENGRLEKRKVDLEYKGYILPSEDADPKLLAEDLEYSGLVGKAWVEEWRLPPYYRRETEVVIFTVERFRNYGRVATITRRRNAGKIVNDHPDPLVEALWSSGYHPFHKLSMENGRPVLMDDPDRLDYESPPLRIAFLEYDSDNSKYRIRLPDVGLQLVHRESITDVLKEYHVHVIASPLDVRLRIQNVDPSINSINAIWVETDNMLTGFNGLMEWARLSRIPLREAARSSIGKILTTIEAFEARKRRYLAVRGYGRLEPFRSLIGLAEYDRGGSIYSPQPGVYWGVIQIDFNSLYPSIISRYNISGETVEDPDCKNTIEPPGSDHKVCMERRGIVPSVMDFLIPRKDRYKELMERTVDPGLRSVLEERRSAVKWILVASFGYLGYRNSLFGSIMAHESVTSASRSIMKRSREIVEEAGYRVIHVLVDSLFILTGRETSARKCLELAEVVSRETGFRARCESVYRWLVIPRTESGSGAGNKYFGLLSNGEFKIKGLLAIRRDTPALVRDFQKDLLGLLKDMDDPIVLEKLCREMRSIHDVYMNKVKERRLSARDLVIRRRIRNPGWSFNRKIISSPEGIMNRSAEYILIRRGVPSSPRDFNGSLDTRFYLRFLERGFNEVAGELCQLKKAG
ncbi:MAG: hypothetical protein F7B59_02220 [Desulfurococcales archaeon]|nr:hypothetical protein [Desulfurococcales archaeon]